MQTTASSAQRYRKTQAGHDEIRLRARSLSPDQLMGLLFVDERRAHRELAIALRKADETIQALLNLALIEVVPAQASTPGAAPVRAELNISQTRTRMVKALLDQVGPAGESLALKIERARNAQDLKPIMTSAVQLVHAVRGASAAREFESRLALH
jgi:hypothetical protein